MSITINKEEIFATETIEKAGLSSDFEQFAKTLSESKQKAEKDFNARTMGTALVSIGSLAIGSASLQSVLPSNPTLVGACMAVGVAGGLGIAAMELIKQKKMDFFENSKTPYNFFKEKMKINENTDGTLDLSMKSLLLDEQLNESPVNLSKSQLMKQKRESAMEEIESAGLSDDFKLFAEKNRENHLEAENSYDPLRESFGVLGAGGLAAAAAQIQYKVATATTVADNSIQNIMNSDNPLLIGAALVGVAGSVGFGVSTYLRQRNLSKMEEDIYNPNNFLKELAEKNEERKSVFSGERMGLEEDCLLSSLKVDIEDNIKVGVKQESNEIKSDTIKNKNRQKPN